MAPRNVTITLKKLTGMLKGFVEVTARDKSDIIAEPNDRWRAHKQWGDSRVVGKAIFGKQPDGTYYPSIVDVLPSYQRHGIATKMYQLLQKRMRARVVPSTDQTDAGRRFWVGMRRKGSLLGGLMRGCR